MRRFGGSLGAAFLASAALAGPAFADGASFAEMQSADDQLYHIDVTLEYTRSGAAPRDAYTGAGTVRVSLPGVVARFDPARPTEPGGYNCSVTNSVYGQAGAGFACDTVADGPAFPTSVTVHLLSTDCYDPPPQGSGQPAVGDVWAAPSDPGTPPDATYSLLANVGCDSGVDEPPVDTVTPLVCTVPKLKNVVLTKATIKLHNAGCARGKVRYVYSSKVKKGRVISQGFKPGKRLKGGTKVKLVVSLGRKRR